MNLHNILARAEAFLAPHGLETRGALHPRPDEGVNAGTVILIGHLGGKMWPHFSRGDAPDKHKGEPDPLDNWSRQIIDALVESLNMLATGLSCQAAYPFAQFVHPESKTPQWLPFQRWAMRAEGLKPGPIGPLMHPEAGLWHAYRGALLINEKLALGPSSPDSAYHHPCDSCIDRPCLTTCPVHALDDGSYNVPACTDWVQALPIEDSDKAESCRHQGCLARLACPIGRDFIYPQAQRDFHMRAFLRAQKAD